MNSAVTTLIYIANIRLPTEKAHGLQIMKTCEALAERGVVIKLIVPQRKNPWSDDPFIFYGVKKIFSIIHLPCWDLISSNRFGSAGFWLESYTFFCSVKKFLKTLTGGIVYTRDLPIAHWLLSKKINLFYEVHTLPQRLSRIHRSVFKKSSGIVVISDGLKNKLILEGILKNKIAVARDAVSVEQFKVLETKEQCREKLGLPDNKKIIVYTGHLYDWKGGKLLALAAKFLPETIIYLVGGTEADVTKFKKMYQFSNLHIMGWQPHDKMPFWHKAADILVLPTSGRDTVGALYTSPLKLFEYLVSGTALVVADLPSLREVLGPSDAQFFVPDQVDSLVEALKVVLAKTEKHSGLEAVRVVDLGKFSWGKRAEIIENFLNLQLGKKISNP